MSKSPTRKPPRRSKASAKLKELLTQPTILDASKPSPDRFDPYGGKPYLPTDYNERKGLPIMTGVLDYFPLALLEVAGVSFAGNAQHNPGEALHWARGKSMDQVNTAVRHMMERGTRDVDGKYHMAKAIWRLLAGFQIQLEQERGLPPSRGCTADQRDDG